MALDRLVDKFFYLRSKVEVYTESVDIELQVDKFDLYFYFDVVDFLCDFDMEQ